MLTPPTTLEWTLPGSGSIAKGAELPPPDLSPFAPEQRLVTNSLAMKLALIPSGEFVMGSPPGELGRSVAELPHRVRIARPFYLGVCEVTVTQFRCFVVASGYRPYQLNCDVADNSYPSHFSLALPAGADAYSWENPGFPQRDDHPVVFVSWADAVAYCQWLGGKENRTYRLPTEAEWEYACRAGTTRPYSMAPFGPSGPFPANLGPLAHDQQCRRIAWRDGFDYTAPVGSFPPNPLGLCDMHGNVCEYCSDFHESGYYGRSPSTDPQGPELGKERVVRGGGWNEDLVSARSARRSSSLGSMGHPFVGFRVARGHSLTR